MSDQPKDTGPMGGDQLFKQMDAQEQIYAPQQVPGSVPVPEERDAQGSAGTAREQLDEGQIGILPMRPDPSTESSILVPFVSHNDDNTNNDNQGVHDTTQGRG